jgi:hypothetical protein
MLRRALLILVTTTACSAHGSFEEDAGTKPQVSDAAPSPDAGPNPLLLDGGPLDGTPVMMKAMNLIPNGDFEKGNTLFGSDYTYAMLNTTEGQYTVGTNAAFFNGALVNTGDHTSGTTKMFIGNGKDTPDRVWFTATLSVKPSTKYYFEAFVMNLYGYNNNEPVGPSVLSFYANGQLLGTRTSMKVGVWEGLTTDWQSGASTTVDLVLVNANTQRIGNDFAVDDIYLGTISTVNPPN